MSEWKEFSEDFAFLDNITLWGLIKGIVAVALIYSLMYTVWQDKNERQEEQRIAEVGMAVSALADEGYAIYIDGERQMFIPGLENYDIEFDQEGRQINLTRRNASEASMLKEISGIGEGRRGILGLLR